MAHSISTAGCKRMQRDKSSLFPPRDGNPPRALPTPILTSLPKASAGKESAAAASRTSCKGDRSTEGREQAGATGRGAGGAAAATHHGAQPATRVSRHAARSLPARSRRMRRLGKRSTAHSYRWAGPKNGGRAAGTWPAPSASAGSPGAAPTVAAGQRPEVAVWLRLGPRGLRRPLRARQTEGAAASERQIGEPQKEALSDGAGACHGTGECPSSRPLQKGL